MRHMGEQKIFKRERREEKLQQADGQPRDRRHRRLNAAAREKMQAIQCREETTTA
jgi:hypothetical protein